MRFRCTTIAALTLCLSLSGAQVFAQELISVSPYDPGQVELELSAYPDFVRARLPLGMLDHAIRQGIEGAESKEIELRVHSAGFTNYADGNPSIGLNLKFDLRHKPTGERFTCNSDITFAIPVAPILDIKSQILSNESRCTASGTLANMLDLGGLLTGLINTGIQSGLDRALLSGEARRDLLELIRNDTTLGFLARRAFVQAAYCDSPRWQKGLCLTIGFRSLTLKNFVQGLDAPEPKGPIHITPQELRARALEFIAAAPLMPHNADSAPSASFPAKRRADGTYDDGDATIFNGLLCLANIDYGCRAVAGAQGPDGRFWRSPNRVGHSEINSFSGDQMNGVLGFLAQTRNATSLIRLLDYLQGNRISLPLPSYQLDNGYKSCLDDKDNTCLVGGAAWIVIHQLAQGMNLTDHLPADMKDPTAKFNRPPSVLVWEALLTPAGYRLHLVGIQIFLAQKLGSATSEHALAAKLLAARQPRNPFFLFLHLGPDDRVLEELDSKCIIDPAAIEFTQWAWERSDDSDAWKKSMRWDCAFMYALLGSGIN